MFQLWPRREWFLKGLLSLTQRNTESQSFRYSLFRFFPQREECSALSPQSRDTPLTINSCSLVNKTPVSALRSPCQGMFLSVGITLIEHMENSVPLCNSVRDNIYLWDGWIIFRFMKGIADKPAATIRLNPSLQSYHECSSDIQNMRMK